MLANRREKIIAITFASALGLFVADQYALSPYLETRSKVSADLQVATDREEKAQRLLANQTRVDRAMRELTTTVVKTDPAAAESQALHAMRDFAQSARVDLQSLKPDRVGRTGDFQQIRLAATGNATTATIAEYLRYIESASIPLRVNDMRLTSRKEGSDDLSFSLNVSTIVFSPAPEKPVKSAPKTVNK